MIFIDLNCNNNELYCSLPFPLLEGEFLQHEFSLLLVFEVRECVFFGVIFCVTFAAKWLLFPGDLNITPNETHTLLKYANQRMKKWNGKKPTSALFEPIFSFVSFIFFSYFFSAVFLSRPVCVYDLFVLEQFSACFCSFFLTIWTYNLSDCFSEWHSIFNKSNHIGIFYCLFLD